MVKKRSTKKTKSKIDFPYKKISISWYDANSDSGWLTLDQMTKHEPALCHTNAWVFEENNKYIKLFGTYSIDKETQSIEFGEVICIPKTWII